MYKIKTNAAITFSLSGMPMGGATIAIGPGANWFGFTGAQPSAITDAISVAATVGDKIISQNEGFAIYTNSGWQGTLGQLQPGCGYQYITNEDKTLVIGAGY